MFNVRVKKKLSALEDYRRYKPTNIKKNFLTLFLSAGVLLLLYSLSSGITKFLFNLQSTEYKQVDQGSQLEHEDVDLMKIKVDLTEYLREILNSEYMEELFQEYMDKTGLTPEEFMELYGDELDNLFGSLNGEEFDPNLLDDFPAEIAAILLAKPMFWATESNPSLNPWDNPENTLFKITSYDEYDLADFKWKASTALDNLGTLEYDSGSSNEKKWRIEADARTASSFTVGVPSIFPSPRILDYSLISDPVTPEGELSMKQQVFLGGATIEGSFGINDGNKNTNITYDLLYDANDYPARSYYESNSLDMDDYSGSNSIVYACLEGPKAADGGGYLTWLAYRESHPFFSAVLDEVAAYSQFQSATNAYTKTVAIINYVGENFEWNPYNNARPGSNEDPIEWFSEKRQSNRPFEFSALITAIGRFYGLSIRYVSGYKWSDDLATQFGGVYSKDGLEVHTYRIANAYTWVECFMPLTSSTGEWVEFDNKYTEVTEIPEGDSRVQLNVQWNGYFGSHPTGYYRSDTATFTATLLYNDAPVGGQTIHIYDTTYPRYIGNATTDGSGLATLSFPLGSYVAGAHVLNVTCLYAGSIFHNLTVLDITNQVDIYINPITPDPLNTQFNTEFGMNVTGWAWDPVMNMPVKHALIDLNLFQGVINQTSYINPIERFGRTNNTGNFTIQTHLKQGGYFPPSGTYEMYSNFDGIFDIGALFNTQPGTQVLVSPFNINTLYSQHRDRGYIITDVFDTFTIFDYWNYDYQANINGTTTGNIVYGNRNMYLQFNAYTQQGGNGVNGSIAIYDNSEGNRLLCSFNTVNGFGSYLLRLDMNPMNWSAGPHYLSSIWKNASMNLNISQWVFIIAPVRVNQTSQVYYGPRAGGSYFIDESLDTFNITGNLNDPLTGKVYSGYQIYFGLYDKNNLTQNSYLTGASLFMSLSRNQYVYQELGFYFHQTTSIDNSPYRTFSYFRGEWVDGPNGWNPSWNSFWIDNPVFLKEDNSSTLPNAVLKALDGTESNMSAWVNNLATPFAASYNSASVPILLEGQSVTLICNFSYLNLYAPAVTVELYDLSANNRFMWSNTTQNGTVFGDGSASFRITFGSSFNPGPHQFQLKITYIPGSKPIYKYQTTWIVYNKTSTAQLSFTLNRNNYNNLTRGVDTTIINGKFGDQYGQGFLFARLRMAVFVNNSIVPYSNYFSILSITGNNLPIVVDYSNNGSFSLTIRPLANCPLGNFSIMFYFDGTFEIPTSPPLLIFESFGSLKNSTVVNCTIRDQPTINTNYQINNPPEYGNALIIGISNVTINGTLRLSNNTEIVGKTVTLTIYNALGQIQAVKTNTTIINGYYEFTQVPVTGDFVYYIVRFDGYDVEFLLNVQTPSIYFPG